MFISLRLHKSLHRSIYFTVVFIFVVNSAF